MLIGKWHCGDQKEFLPTSHGFDQFYGLPYSNDMGISEDYKSFPPLPLMLDEEVLQEQPDQSSLTERYVEKGVRFIRDNKKEPFFLYFAHMYVHQPLFTPEHFLRQSQNGKYGAAVECIDWATGVILDELKKQGLEKNTLVVFTSDNGCRGDKGGSNAPLRGRKGTTWEGGQRLPCIMYWPEKIAGGVECDDIVTSLDFYPTFARIGHAEIPKDRIIDGIDVSSVLLEGEKSPRSTFFYYLGDNLEAVRYEKWKLHLLKAKVEIKELYDMEQDIGESNNLYRQYPEVVLKLEGLMEECRQDIGDGALGIEGKNIRPKGKVEHPNTLTHYNPNHPYIIAMYDSEDHE